MHIPAFLILTGSGRAAKDALFYDTIKKVKIFRQKSVGSSFKNKRTKKAFQFETFG